MPFLCSSQCLKSQAQLDKIMDKLEWPEDFRSVLYSNFCTLNIAPFPMDIQSTLCNCPYQDFHLQRQLELL